MAVASFQPSAVVYREEQNFDWRVYVLVALAEALAGLTLVWFSQRGVNLGAGGGLTGVALSLVAFMGIGLPLFLFVGLLRMTTEVTPTDVRVWYGWIPTYRRVLPLGSIQKIEVVTYRPVLDYGGWGLIPNRDGEHVLRARGNRGVRLELSDGTRLLIGSQRPEPLAVAIERNLQPGSC